MNKLLFDKIQHRLVEKGIKFSANNGYIQFNMNIDGVVGKLHMIIDVLDTAYVSYAVLGNKVSEKTIEKVAEFLHRANYGLLYGNFEIDYTDGEIRYKIVTECENANNLTNKQVDKSVLLPCVMFEKYGDGMIKLMLGVGDAESLIKEAEDNK